ncbi:MAG: DUF3352 domain-containing protein [Nocardioides sp.]
MTDQFPPATHDGEPEYLGGPVAPEDTARPARRWGVVAAGAAAVLVAAGAGAWGVAQLVGGGSGPASAVPSIAVAYVSIDLDPSAGQKIEALRTLKKFPALADTFDLGVRDDLRRWVFEQIQEQDGCPGVDYGRDVEPWLGDRMALAAVPDDTTPLAPLLAVQVSDREAAAAGVEALQACGDGTDGATASDGADEPAGVAFVGDYMLVTEHQDDADAMARAAEAAPLEDDPAYSTWMERVGDPGFLTAYVTPDAPQRMTELGDELGGVPGAGKVGERMRGLWKDFEGLAAVVRFHDGSVEAEVAAAGLPAGATVDGPTGPSLETLPDTTAAAMTLSLRPGWLQGYLDSIGAVLSAGESVDEFWTGVESDTGLALPEDVETLLGDGFSLSVDASADLGAMERSYDVPTAPVALRVSGDAKASRAVLDRVLGLVGVGPDDVAVRNDDGLLVVGLDPDYVEKLAAADGDLGDSETFTAVVPEAGRASSALYVDFDVNGWLDALTDGDAEASANLAPLRALGLSAWQADGVQHGLLRLSTD